MSAPPSTSGERQPSAIRVSFGLSASRRPSPRLPTGRAEFRGRLVWNCQVVSGSMGKTSADPALCCIMVGKGGAIAANPTEVYLQKPLARGYLVAAGRHRRSVRPAHQSRLRPAPAEASSSCCIPLEVKVERVKLTCFLQPFPVRNVHPGPCGPDQAVCPKLLKHSVDMDVAGADGIRQLALGDG